MRSSMLRSTAGLISGYAWVILLVAVCINLVTQMGRNAYAVTGPDLTDSLSLSYAQLGILLTSYSILLMAGAFVFGALASRYGARFIVAGGAFMGALAMVGIGFAENFAVAVVASGVLGLASSAATTPVMGMLASWFSTERRGVAAGLAAAGGGVSFIVIGALTPELVDRDPVDGWRHSWWALAAISGLIGLVALVFLRELPGGRSVPKRGLGNWPIEVYKNRLVWTVAAVAFCAGWSIGLYTTFFGVFLEERGISLDTTGRLFQLIGVLSIISGIVWGYASDLIGRRMGFLLSFVAFGGGHCDFLASHRAGRLHSFSYTGRVHYPCCVHHMRSLRRRLRASSVLPGCIWSDGSRSGLWASTRSVHRRRARRHHGRHWLGLRSGHRRGRRLRRHIRDAAPP